MKVGDQDWRSSSGPWSIDNLFVLGNMIPGEYVILHEGHEIARGSDPVEMLRIVDAANAAEVKQEQAA